MDSTGNDGDEEAFIEGNEDRLVVLGIIGGLAAGKIGM